MPAQPGSITEIQTRTGVEVCTFRLVLKNAASLLDKDDPLKVNADAALDALIRSFVALDRLLADGAAGATSRRYVLNQPSELCASSEVSFTNFKLYECLETL
jgi:hypothetical protein